MEINDKELNLIKHCLLYSRNMFILINNKYTKNVVLEIDNLFERFRSELDV